MFEYIDLTKLQVTGRPAPRREQNIFDFETSTFHPFDVGTAVNRIAISTFGDGPRPIINNNGVIHPHPTRSDDGGERYDGERDFVLALSSDIPNSGLPICTLGDVDLSEVVDFSDIQHSLHFRPVERFNAKRIVMRMVLLI